MKKSIFVLLLILTGLTMCCAVSAARSDISGDVYKLLSFAGVEINSLGFSEDMMVVTLYPDGTASVSEEGKDADTGSWTLDGNDITISTGGDSLRGTLEGDTLTLNIEGADFVLVKETPEPAEENEPSGFSRLVSSIWSSLTGKNKEPEPTPTEIPQPTETPAPLPAEESSSSDAKSKWANLANTVRDSRDSVENEQAAADDVRPAAAPAAETALPGSLRVGDTFTFGHYEQDNDLNNGPEPIEWQVLAVENGRVLVISKYALDAKPFNETKTEGVTWETCTLRSWLNSEFLKNAFSSEEQNRIQLVTNRTPDHEDSGNPGRIGYGGNDTKDRIFLLSIDEARQYFGRDFSCEATAFAEAHKTEGAVHITSWWLRSTGLPLYGKNYNAAVCGDDMMYAGGDTVSSTNNVVRPAFWLDLKGSADSGTAEQTAVTKPTAQPAANGLPSSFRVGDLFTFGHYEQDNNTSNGKEPIQWQVLAVENGQALVISKFALDGKRFNETGYTGNWETSTLQKWLNADFRGSAFSMPEQALIAESIFLLSRDEANRYFGSDLARQCKPTAYAESQKANTFNGNAYWWLRSADASGYPDLVIHDGSVNNQYANDIMAVRPAFRLDLNGSAETGQSEKPGAPAQTSEDSLPGSFRVGDTFTFGHYEQDNDLNNGPEPIEWQVLAVENGQVLVISKYALDSLPYNTVSADVSWETCSLRAWLNDQFFTKAFSPEERSKIAWITNKNPGPDASVFILGTPAPAGNDTVDHVFLLSKDEAERYFSSNEARQCRATAYANARGADSGTEKYPENATWWLRTRTQTYREAGKTGYMTSLIYPGGNYSDFLSVNFEGIAVRPALWLDPDRTAGAAETAGSTGLKRPDAVYTEPAKPAQTSASSESGRYVDSCRMKSYLKPGDHAEVVTERGLKLRKKPAGTETGVQAFAGKDVEILDGPVCRNGSVWFEINFLGYRGWSMEGLDGIYYLRKTDGTPTRPDPSPKRTQPTPRPTASSGDMSPRTGNSKYSSRLKIGDTVEVINTGGLQLYMTPNGKYYDGVAAWPGKAAKVTDGPQYDKNGSIWWEIDFLGHRGWVLEVTTKGTYYLEKK